MSEITAKIVLDSCNTVTGDRLTTIEAHVPKFILAEINTHRCFSRNAASSRAIPAPKIRRQVLRDPVIPVSFGANQRGMQAERELKGIRLAICRRLWLLARYGAIFFHWLCDCLGLHKQIVNRILEPWMWVDVLISSTEWNNFIALRCHKDAQPEFQVLAKLIRDLRINSFPTRLAPGQWHLPYADPLDRINYDLDQLKAVSAARCARVSYLVPEGGYSTPERDLELCRRLKEPPLHASPFEHVAVALPASRRAANFVGWQQWRADFPNESNGDYSRSSKRDRYCLDSSDRGE